MKILADIDANGCVDDTDFTLFIFTSEITPSSLETLKPYMSISLINPSVDHPNALDIERMFHIIMGQHVLYDNVVWEDDEIKF